MVLRLLDPRYWYRRWFVPGPARFDVRDDYHITITLPDPAIAQRRKRLIAFMKNPWIVNIGSGLGIALLLALLAKLFAIL
jgi:hypothetical protein